MLGSVCSARRALIAFSAVAAFVVLPGGGHAEPIDWSGSYSGNGSSLSGQLLGDYQSGLLTLNNVAPKSTLNIDLKDPDPIPLGVRSISDPCPLYSCSGSVNLNSTLTIEYRPWAFDVDGTIEFDDLDPDGGTANLSATPYPPGHAFYIAAFNIEPVFTVNAAQIYGPINQVAANAEAASIEFLLNTGNYNIDIEGNGYWNSIDLGTVTAMLQEIGGVAEVDMSFDNIMLDGTISYESDITFNNSIVNAVSAAFLSAFPNQIDSLVTAGVLTLISSYSDSFDGFAYSCDAEQAGPRSADVTCTIDGNLTVRGELEPRIGIDAPAMAGLLGVGLVGLFAIGRRRRKS